MFLKQQKPEMDNFERYWENVLTDTLAKCNKIFLHILLFKNILRFFLILRKNLHFLAAGGGVDPPPLADASAKNAIFLTCSI